MLYQRVVRVIHGEIELEILVVRGFDIRRVSYGRIPTQWLSAAFFRHAHSFTPSAIGSDGWGWLRTWQGGFLSTIGVDHVGGPAVHANRHLHSVITAVTRFTGGFISLSSTAIEMVNVDWETGTIEIRTSMRKVAPFAEHVVMTGRITMNFDEPTFHLSDVIKNDGYIEELIQNFYHINLGWPF